MAKTAEVLRIAGLLEGLIAFKKVSIRQLENDLGVSHGTLARIFSGKIEQASATDKNDLYVILERPARDQPEPSEHTEQPGEQP